MLHMNYFGQNVIFILLSLRLLFNSSYLFFYNIYHTCSYPYKYKYLYDNNYHSLIILIIGNTNLPILCDYGVNNVLLL